MERSVCIIYIYLLINLRIYKDSQNNKILNT